MAAAGGSGVGGRRRHWLEEEEPGFRSGMLQKLTIKLAPVYEPRYASYSKEVQTFVAKFEEDAFSGTNSKEDYMRNISNKLLIIEKRKDEHVQRRMQSRCNLQRANAPQALQGVDSSVIPNAVMMASQRPTSQPPKTSGLVPNQHMVYPSTPNTQIEIEQKHPGAGMMTIVDRCLNFQPSTAIATRGPGVQLGLRPMQSAASQSQSQSQYPARQPQAMNIVGCGPASVSKPAIRPYSQQNRLLGIGRQQQLTRMNQQTLGANQQEMNMQRYQMLGAQQGDASKSKIQVSQLGGGNNQQDARQRDLLHSPFKACKPEPMTPPLQQISGAQRNILHYQNSQIPATIGSARECDVLEKMFCQIKSWKDAYYSLFVELDHRFAVPALTEEQFSSLPIAKANAYKRRVDTKKLIREILKLLQLRRSDMHEGLRLEFPKYEKHIHNFLGFIERTKARDAKMNIACHLQNCGEQSQVINLTGNASPITGGKSAEQKQPADASILSSSQTTNARTPPAHQHNNGNRLLGIASPSSSISSLGTLQSWSTSMLECLTPSPVTMPVVASASPCAPVMSTFSKDIDSTSAFLLHDNAGAAALKANSSNQVTSSKLTTSASPLQAEKTTGQAEDQAPGGGRTRVTKKPIDRLLDAMRSSSPAALRCSANSIWSVLSIDDIVTRGKVGTILDCKSSQQRQQGEPNVVNKMKRVFNNTASHSESVLSGSIDSSCMTFECDASDSGSTSKLSIKRQKKQNVNDALLEEIKSINSTLIDTVISMSGDCGTDEISSDYGGATIKLSYSAVSISPTVKSLFATSEMSLVLPVKIFVPADYPRSSPVLINDRGDDVLRKNSSAISISVDVAFRHFLADLPEPRSIKETAKAWDACVRKAVTEFAHRHGGGTVSSMLGQWERCAAT